MKEHFNSVNSIFSYYYFLKSNLENIPSHFPDSEQLQDYVQVNRPVNARSLKEDKYAFIGDVETFLDNRLEWGEKFILTSRIVLDGSFPRSYGEIVNDIKGESKKRIRAEQNGGYPRRLCFRQHVRREFLRLFHRAKDYFRARGYV